ERQIKLFLFFAIVTVGLVGIYTLTQVPHVEIFTENRITAPFEGNPEPGTIGGYMAFLIVIVFSIYLYEKRKVRKWLFGVLGLILLIPLLFTLNRSSYAAFVAGVAYITYVERKRKWLVTIVVCLFLTSPLWLPHSVKDRIAFTWRDAKNPGRTMGVDISFEERIVTYEKMWRSLKVSPLIGWGVGSFQTPDSQYARTLHEVGMIGLGFWLWIYFRLFRMARWLFNYLEGGMLKGMVLGYRAGLIGILLHGFGAVTWYIVRIMEPFWFITGLVVSLYLMKVREASRSAVEEISEEPEEALAPVS
ncbi:MAG TPA: O-antigen ligase family protein, partial [bacterium]|nr:O-antigen ligase family protein [bacterium]